MGLSVWPKPGIKKVINIMINLGKKYLSFCSSLEATLGISFIISWKETGSIDLFSRIASAFSARIPLNGEAIQLAIVLKKKDTINRIIKKNNGTKR